MSNTGRRREAAASAVVQAIHASIGRSFCGSFNW